MKTKLLTTLAISLIVTGCASKEQYAFEEAPELMQTKPSVTQLLTEEKTQQVAEVKAEPKIIEIDGIKVELDIDNSSLAAVEDDSSIEEIVILASDGSAIAGKQLEVGQEVIAASVGSIELAPTKVETAIAKPEPRIVYIKQAAPQAAAPKQMAAIPAPKPISVKSMPANIMARDIVASASNNVMGTSYQRIVAAPAPKPVQQPIYEYKRAMAPISSPSESDYDISCDIPSLKDTTASYNSTVNQPRYVSNDSIKSYRYSY